MPVIACGAGASFAVCPASISAEIAVTPTMRNRLRRETSVRSDSGIAGLTGSFISDISFLHFFRQMFGRAPGVGHDGQRYVLIGVAVERRGIRHHEILHLMRLRIL